MGWRRCRRGGKEEGGSEDAELRESSVLRMRNDEEDLRKLAKMYKGARVTRQQLEEQNALSAAEDEHSAEDEEDEEEEEEEEGPL